MTKPKGKAQIFPYITLDTEQRNISGILVHNKAWVSVVSAFLISSNTYNIKQQKREINPKKKDAIAWMVVIKYLKTSDDDLLLQTSFSDLGDHICWNEKRRERRQLGLTKFEGIRKRFEYIPNRIESEKNLNTGTKIRDRSSRTGQ